MKNIKYLIGSKTFSIFYDDTIISRVLQEELVLYPLSSEKTDIEIHFVQVSSKALSINPRSHKEIPNGFSINEKRYSIEWLIIDKSPRIYFNFFGNPNDYLFKFLISMQFTHPFEQIGQTFHEEVIIPALMLYFPDHISPIHGSAVESPEGNGIIFGGTGGVGKTSIELELIFNYGYKFIADDMALVTRKGVLHPNYAYPKIYAYNTINSKDIYKKLMTGRSVIDRFWWHIQKLRSINNTRRRAQLKEFYSGCLSNGTRLKYMFILLRTNCKQIKCRSIDNERAASMNNDIIKTELYRHLNHLYWHEFNRRFIGNKIFDTHRILDQWVAMQKNVFSGIQCWVVEIPLHIDIISLKKYIPQIIAAPERHIA